MSSTWHARNTERKAIPRPSGIRCHRTSWEHKTSSRDSEGKSWFCQFGVMTFTHLSTLCSAPQGVKLTSLLIINYHLSHCSKNEMLLLCFYLSTNALQASSHNHWSLLLGQCPLSSTAGMAHLPLLANFPQFSSYSTPFSWIKPSPGNHYKANTNLSSFVINIT